MIKSFAFCKLVDKLSTYHAKNMINIYKSAEQITVVFSELFTNDKRYV